MECDTSGQPKYTTQSSFGTKVSIFRIFDDTFSGYFPSFALLVLFWFLNENDLLPVPVGAGSEAKCCLSSIFYSCVFYLSSQSKIQVSVALILIHYILYTAPGDIGYTVILLVLISRLAMRVH